VNRSVLAEEIVAGGKYRLRLVRDPLYNQWLACMPTRHYDQKKVFYGVEVDELAERETWVDGTLIPVGSWSNSAVVPLSLDDTHHTAMWQSTFSSHVRYFSPEDHEKRLRRAQQLSVYQERETNRGMVSAAVYLSVAEVGLPLFSDHQTSSVERRFQSLAFVLGKTEEDEAEIDRLVVYSRKVDIPGSGVLHQRRVRIEPASAFKSTGFDYPFASRLNLWPRELESVTKEFITQRG